MRKKCIGGRLRCKGLNMVLKIKFHIPTSIPDEAKSILRYVTSKPDNTKSILRAITSIPDKDKSILHAVTSIHDKAKSILRAVTSIPDKAKSIPVAVHSLCTGFFGNVRKHARLHHHVYNLPLYKDELLGRIAVRPLFYSI